MLYEPKIGYYAIATNRFLAYLTQQPANKETSPWYRTNARVVNIYSGDYFLIPYVENEKRYVRFPFKIIYLDHCYDINAIDAHNFVYSNITTKLNNKSFAIYGKADYDRAVYERLIVMNGGICKFNVSKKLDYLIIGNQLQKTDCKTMKIQKALEQNVNVISTSEFLSLIS